MARRSPRYPVLLLWLLPLLARAGFDPVPLDQLSGEFRTVQDRRGKLTVEVAVPPAKQTAALYGVDLASEQIQAVWLAIENQGDHPVWLLPSAMDPNYFAPGEAAFAFHRQRNLRHHAAIDEHFQALAFPSPVPPGGHAAGFVLTNLDEGVKVVDVDLLSVDGIHSFSHIVEVPGFQADYARFDLDALYATQEIRRIDALPALRDWLTSLPCCAADKKGNANGDPLNVVFIGERKAFFSALLRRNWHVTERLWSRSLVRTTGSFFNGSRYRYSPVSPLYLFGRKQDISLQKTRSSIHERNHMRLWASPVRYRGQEVWIGQISRDIGVKFTLKSPTISTHKIDPDIDDARAALLEDLIYSQRVSHVGAVDGVGQVLFSRPRENLVGDPWYSDGYRAVVWFEDRPRSIDDISLVEPWPSPNRSAPGYPPEHLQSREFLAARDYIDSALRPRAHTRSDGEITASAVLSSRQDSLAIFGIDPLEHGVQPVWIEIANQSAGNLGLIQAGLDPDYISPLELAHLFRKGRSRAEAELLAMHLQALDFRDPVAAGATVSGFVFLNATGYGGRVLDIDLVGHRRAHSVTFILPAPGSNLPMADISAEAIRTDEAVIEISNEIELQQALLELPCCASLEAGDRKGEPLNLVLIGEADEILPGLGRRGYHSIELEDRSVFGRRQDLQGLRQSQWVDSQPHALRLWLTPLVYRGQPVWLGQTSNRRGGRFTEVSTAGQAAMLDPDTDEARRDMAQDLAYSQAVSAWAMVYGAGREYRPPAPGAPRPVNYFTDGKRAVLFFSRQPVALNRIRLLGW